MSPEELAAIRERRGIRLPNAPTASEDIAALLAEVERLTRRLNQDVGLLLGERDRALELSRSMAQEVHNAQARLDKVRALHKPVDVEPSDTICAGCSTLRGSGESLRYFPYEEWPCPTIHALDGSDQ